MNTTEAAEYGSSWHAATKVATPECRFLNGDVDVDVCIVGGGITGLTVARELARRNWSVALLEAGRVGADGLGQGAGIVAPGFSEPFERVLERVGRDRARELWALSVEGAEYVRRAISELRLPDIGATSGFLVIQRSDDEGACHRKANLLGAIPGIQAEVWPAERVRSMLRGARDFPALHLPNVLNVHPLNYTLGLAAAARAAGARIYEQTPALAIDHAGIRKRVQTAAGRVRARLIVLGASRDAARLHAPLAGTIMTLGQPLGVTTPLGDRLASAIDFRGAIAEEGAAGRVYRTVGHDRLLWAGPLTARVRASEPMGAALRRQIARNYPQLGSPTVHYVWLATGHYAVHRMPLIGELASGLWFAGAFGHRGMAAASMAGDLIARALHAGDDRWRLFQPFGLVWAGGQAGRVVIRVALGIMHARNWARDRLMRRDIEPSTAQPACPLAERQPSASRPATLPDQAKSGAKKTKRNAKRRSGAKKHEAKPRPAAIAVTESPAASPGEGGGVAS